MSKFSWFDKFVFFVVLVLGICLESECEAQTEGSLGTHSCTDNFNDNFIDGSIWSTLVDSGTVLETNNRIEFDDWGFLVTQQEYDPCELGMVIISGTWWSPNNWNVSASDRLKVATRSDGELGTGAGNLSNGILFETNWDFGSPRLVIGKHSGPSQSTLAEVPADFGPGDVIDFVITDDGNMVTFTIQPRGVGRHATKVTANDDQLFAENHIVFYSRPDHNGLQTRSYFDDISISIALVKDNFDDNTIDTSLWDTLVALGSITAVNQSAEFHDWGFLTTIQQYDPNELGTIAVAGTWWSPNNWNVSASDRLKVATRSDGAPGIGAGNLSNGILFETNWDFGNPRLVIGKHAGPSQSVLAEVPADFGPGDIIDFLITDNGEGMTFMIQPRGEGRQPTMLSATDDEMFDDNHVVFYSRPDHNGLQTLCYFDNLSITTNNCKVLLGDLNVDGSVNLLDVQPLVDAINLNFFQTEGDINSDGSVNLLDVQPFIDALTDN